MAELLYHQTGSPLAAFDSAFLGLELGVAPYFR